MITAATKQVQNRFSQSSPLLEGWQLSLRPKTIDALLRASFMGCHDEVVADLYSARSDREQTAHRTGFVTIYE